MSDILGFLVLNSYSFIIVVGLSIIFFGKKRRHFVEDNTYSEFLLITLFTSLVGLLLGICVIPELNMGRTMIIVLNKVYLYLLIIWALTLTFYALYISVIKEGQAVLGQKVFYIIKIICAMMVIMMPIRIEMGETGTVSSGVAVIFAYLVVAMAFITQIILMVIDRKNLKNRKYIPIWLLIFLGVFTLILQMIFPRLNYLINPSLVLISLIMYFTIENPDMKMVEALIENRKIIERASEEKSIFFFKMSQGIKEPVNHISKQITRYIKEPYSRKKTNQIIETIGVENGKIHYLVNDVVGISPQDESKIKKRESCYRIYQLLEDVKIRAKGYIKEGIDYTFSMTQSIPEELIGDAIKFKQVLMSLLINAGINTREGFIHVDVNAITKYDICRLVISIIDSGSGIELNQVNTILSQEEELSEEDYLKLEQLDIDLPLSYKIIKSLGGTMYIKSEVGKGTEVLITLDQYILESNKAKQERLLIDSFENYGKRVLLIDNDEIEISKIKAYLSKLGYDVVVAMLANDAINRIKMNEKYGAILIDDELSEMSGITVLKDLTKLKNQSRKVVILNKEKMFISSHYIEDGFDDYINRETLFKELDRLFLE